MYSPIMGTNYMKFCDKKSGVYIYVYMINYINQLLLVLKESTMLVVGICFIGVILLI